jgi:hypothetical protein
MRLLAQSAATTRPSPSARTQELPDPGAELLELLPDLDAEPLELLARLLARALGCGGGLWRAGA